MSENIIEEWAEWLKGDLWHQVHELFNQLHIYRSWNDIVGAAVDESKRPGLFHAWVLHNYLDSIASGVRRLSDRDNRTNSLVRLLQEIEAGTEHLTRDWWMSTAVPGDERVWEHRFNELSAGGDAIDPGVVNRDRERVVAACEKVKSYVDTHIAHLDADRDRIDMPTIGDVHDAIRTIYSIYHNWFVVVTRESLAPLEPPRWEDVLSMAWINSETASQISERRREEWDREMRELGVTL
jgi:hypothetical protein